MKYVWPGSRRFPLAPTKGPLYAPGWTHLHPDSELNFGPPPRSPSQNRILEKLMSVLMF